MEKKCKKAKWLSEEALHSCEKKRSEKQRRKGKIYPFECRVPRIARRDKKAFLSDQCKEIEENNRMISVCFQSKPFSITVIQAYAPATKAEEDERFYEDLQDLLELTPKKDVLFITGDWNAKVGRQEIPGATGKLRLGL